MLSPSIFHYLLLPLKTSGKTVKPFSCFLTRKENGCKQIHFRRQTSPSAHKALDLHQAAGLGTTLTIHSSGSRTTALQNEAERPCDSGRSNSHRDAAATPGVTHSKFHGAVRHAACPRTLHRGCFRLTTRAGFTRHHGKRNRTESPWLCVRLVGLQLCNTHHSDQAALKGGDRTKQQLGARFPRLAAENPAQPRRRATLGPSPAPARPS